MQCAPSGMKAEHSGMVFQWERFVSDGDHHSMAASGDSLCRLLGLRAMWSCADADSNALSIQVSSSTSSHSPLTPQI